jgi:hypothetical protein
MMESLPNLTEANFPGLGKTVKMPKTMGLNTSSGNVPLIRDGMFNSTDLASGTFSPSAATGQQFSSVVNDMLTEEAKAMSSTTVKKSSAVVRKKLIVPSKTQRAGNGLTPDDTNA